MVFSPSESTTIIAVPENSDEEADDIIPIKELESITGTKRHAVGPRTPTELLPIMKRSATS